MRINIFLIPFVIIVGLFFVNYDNRRNRRLYIIICSSVLLVVAAMRSPEFMTYTYLIDTLGYKDLFEQCIDISWQEFGFLIIERLQGVSDEDIGFVVFLRIIAFFTHDFYIYSIIADLFFFVPFGIILYRYCTSVRQIIFAYVFYIAMIQILFLGGGRQNIAVGFDLMALLSIIDGKKVRTIVLFLIGVTIHFSSFLFIAPLLMIWFGVGPKTLKIMHVVLFVLFPIALVMPNQIVSFMGVLSGVERYAQYGAGDALGSAYTFIILIELLSLFCLLAIKKRDLSDNNIRFFYVMVPLFTFLAPLIRSNGAIIRVSFYFHLFLTILVPFGIDCMFSEKDRKIAYFVSIAALAFLALRNGGIQYYFFWQINNYHG